MKKERGGGTTEGGPTKTRRYTAYTHRGNLSANIKTIANNKGTRSQKAKNETRKARMLGTIQGGPLHTGERDR